MSNPEVLIYIDRIKQFLNLNEDARRYFLNNLIDENTFFENLYEISEKNYTENGEPELTQEQLEGLRNKLIVEKISTQQVYKYSEDGLFLFYKNYLPVCMN
jgi:hypothetical protein